MKELLKCFRRSLVTAIIRSSARVCRALPTGKTLVIAPHPDDETFGCGGLVAMKRAHHVPADLLFLSSGEASHNDCCRIDQAKLAEARRGQALAAAELLGVTGGHLHWLDMPDGSIPGKCSLESDDAVDQIARVMKRYQPAEIYCPHPLDTWPDHEATARLVLQAAQTAGFRFQVFFYLVWGWYGMQFRNCGRVAGFQSCRVAELQGCRVAGRKERTMCERRLGRLRPLRVDISSVLNKKLAAIQEYVGKHPAGCPHPYVGGLPDGFLKPFQKPYEIFFEPVESEHVLPAADF